MSITIVVQSDVYGASRQRYVHIDDKGVVEYGDLAGTVKTETLQKAADVLAEIKANKAEKAKGE